MITSTQRCIFNLPSAALSICRSHGLIFWKNKIYYHLLSLIRVPVLALVNLPRFSTISLFRETENMPAYLAKSYTGQRDTVKRLLGDFTVYGTEGYTFESCGVYFLTSRESKTCGFLLAYFQAPKYASVSDWRSSIFRVFPRFSLFGLLGKWRFSSCGKLPTSELTTFFPPGQSRFGPFFENPPQTCLVPRPVRLGRVSGHPAVSPPLSAVLSLPLLKPQNPDYCQKR